MSSTQNSQPTFLTVAPRSETPLETSSSLLNASPKQMLFPKKENDRGESGT